MDNTLTTEQMSNYSPPEVLDDGFRKPDGYGDGSRVDYGGYRGKTHELPRPTAAEWTSATQLERAQQQWDNAEYNRRHQAQVKAAFEARWEHERTEKQRQHAEEERRIAARQREQLLEPARLAFLRNGGTPDEWEAQKDEIAADILRSRAVQAGTTPAAHSLIPRSTV